MSVYRRGSAKVYYMDFVVNGKRVFKSTGETTRRAAKSKENAERRKQMKLKSEQPDEQNVVLLRNAIQHVYDSRWQYNKDGVRALKRAMHVAELIGDMPIEQISEEAIKKLIKQIEANGCKPATVNRYLSGIKTVLKECHLPAEHIKIRKEKRTRMRVISREEEKEILGWLRGNDSTGYFADVADLIEVLLGTACRLSEGLRIQLKDIDLESNLLLIENNKADRRHSVPMTSRVRGILTSRCSCSSKPFSLSVNQAEYAWRRARKALGLDGADQPTIHSTRHTAASRMIAAGVDIYTVKHVLNHADISTTQIYAHLSPHKLTHAISTLED